MAIDQGQKSLGGAVTHGWKVKRRTCGSHRVLECAGWPDVVFAFHDDIEIGPRMLARIARRTGLRPEDL